MTVPAADNLRRIAAMYPQWGEWFRPSIAAADLLDAIDALHQPDGYDRSDILIACVGCGDFWPCDTARLLRPEEAA